MNLPVVIDIAIGLIFIYLILSLLTSEIQELITILLQWRAEHLKRSIENLFTGDSVDDPLYQKFTDKFYNSPLIKALNQEAKGRLAVSFRKGVQSIAALYYFVTKTRSVFRNQKSGPSYIPAKTFSAALLQQVRIKELSQKVSELTARKFSTQKLAQICAFLNTFYPQSDRSLDGEGLVLKQQYQNLQQSLDQTIADLVNGRSILSSCLEQLSAQMALFLDGIDLESQSDRATPMIRSQLAYLKQAIAERLLEPTVTEVLQLIFNQGNAAQNPGFSDILTDLKAKNPELLSQSELPKQLQMSLLSLAQQSQIKSKNLQEGVNQLEQEVSDWFDTSMDRASGVYRRNAKGIAILIGFFFAIATNSDTFYMVSRLSKDTLLRSTISQAADQAVVSTSTTRSPNSTTPTNSPIQTDLKSVKTAVDDVLDELPLPVGWNKIVVDEQVQDEKKGWLLPIPQRVLGWFVTGLALSMGAAFWYDLLNRFTQVRGTGAKPDEK
ncbi:MAG: hypothetical protein KME11_10015 [Timaviella obliquedivisa GSE-PSE-MK23-08B]|jgi:hypothetical protein|nr:hypothetical protein [Timaviella obliquedivisa GSE-PSE-MK23-08B]